MQYRLYIFLVSVLITGKATVLFAQAEPIKEVSEEVFLKVEQMPEFPGGQDSLWSFIQENIQYPEKSREQQIQGTVYARFIVNKTGKAEKFEIVRGINDEMNNEVLRVLKLMPDWSPGKQNGKAVSTQFVLPVKFALGK